jgi:hypothetical protein
MRFAPALAAGLLAVSVSALPAMAQRAAPKNASEAIVTNARTVAVTGLEITTAKGEKVGTLKAPLQPGKRISFKFRPRNGCLFTVNAAFADEAEFDQQEVDLCTDKNIRFVD